MISSCCVQVSLKVGESINGQLPVSWQPHVEWEHFIYIQLNSVSIPGTPSVCTVRTGQNYAKIGPLIMVIGKEGSKDGELSCPWGVCCTKVITYISFLVKACQKCTFWPPA